MKRSTRIFGNFMTASLLVLSLLGAMPVSIVQAAALSYTVNALDDVDDGACNTTHCSLREAINAANLNPNGPLDTDTINFSVNGTISPISILPYINGNLVIDGTNYKIKISGSNTRRVLHILTGTVTINNLTIQNGIDASNGGGILNVGTLTVSNSTFTGNQAGYGGAIANFGTLTIANSTFDGNNASASGGGVYNQGASLTILNSTFSGNSAATSGGGVYNQSGMTMNMINNILANSTGGGDCANAGSIGSNTNNIIMDGSCSPSLVGDPKLDALADNGGYTQTMALLIDSPAREAGDNTICAAAPVNGLDQRGVIRPRGPNCDIGAYEADYASNIVINPNPLNFGEQAIGTTSTVKSVTVTYTGIGTINIYELTISGEFAFSGSNNCNYATLGTGGYCSFGVTFSPTTIGAKTGAVTIPSNALSSPDSLSLTGKGTNPSVGLSATTLTFSPQYIDTTSLSKKVTITNTGTGTLSIGTLLTSGDFIVHSNTCNGARLLAGGTCNFSVAFSPFSSASGPGLAAIPSNASTSPNRVILRGTTRDGTQLLKMGNFDMPVAPLPWVVSAEPLSLARIRDCHIFRSPFCSAMFTGSRQNKIVSALQVVLHSGSAGDQFFIGLSSRASNVPAGGQYKLLVSFLGNSGVVGSRTFLFSSGTHGFQTVGVNYTVPAAYTRIMFNFTYQKTGGVVWFDDGLLILLP
jgi:CSLREA domain-containing protein